MPKREIFWSERLRIHCCLASAINLTEILYNRLSPLQHFLVPRGNCDRTPQLLSHCFYRMFENVSLFCQTTINHTITQSNASKGPSGRFVFNCPIACNSLELFCTCLCKVALFCFHAR